MNQPTNEKRASVVFTHRSLNSHPRRSQVRFPTRQKKATARPNLAVPPVTSVTGRMGKPSKHRITWSFYHNSRVSTNQKWC